MKTVYWLFVVSVALFVSGVAFIIAGERTARAATPTAAAAPDVAPVATVKQIMIGITNPSAYVIYEAVGTKSTAAGVEEIAPQNDEEWANVRYGAIRLVEAADGDERQELLIFLGRASLAPAPAARLRAARAAGPSADAEEAPVS